MSQGDLIAYAARVDRLMGARTVTFNRSKTHTNHVIGALNHAQFAEFTENFDARIIRLHEWTNGHIGARNFVKHALNELSSDKNWDGAYAELVAVDYFASVCKVPVTRLNFDVHQLADRTIASDMGMANVDFDFGFPTRLCYLDVKVLSDKSRQIVDGIVQQVQKQLGLGALQILSFFDTDTDYKEFQNNRSVLLNELKSSLSNGLKPVSIESEIIPGLKYEPVWTPGVHMNSSPYSPERHAETHHKLLFQHAKKFHRSRSTVLMFVYFPWSGEKLVALPWGDVPKQFFSAMCLKFFEGYKGSTLSATERLKNIQTNITADSLTRELAGVVFLEDAAITSQEPNSANVAASYYMNPRFKRRILAVPMCLFLRHNAQDLKSWASSDHD